MNPIPYRAFDMKPKANTRTLGTAFDVVENLLQNVYIFPAEFD
jgi:hypothetical protein